MDAIFPIKILWEHHSLNDAEKEMRRRQYERLYDVEATIKALANLNK